MKKYLLIILLSFLAFSFQLDNPPGWYQVPLPVNDFINDIFFIDSLNGWAVTDGNKQSNDTGYILHTTNGGDNWVVQFLHPDDINVIQFTDVLTGYASGGFGRAVFFRTTNGGINWDTTRPFGSNMYTILGLQFINKDTGWICSDDSFGGGVFRTTNGGINWEQQAPASNKPIKLFFVSAYTGWYLNGDVSGKVYKTTNSGINWNLQFTFPSPSAQVSEIFFLNQLTGWILGGGGGTTVKKTTNGGNNWTGITALGGGPNMIFLNESTGYAGAQFNKVFKTIDGGYNWIQQSSPIFNNEAIFFLDTLRGWAGGTGIVKTTDGGATSINQISNEIPTEYELYQNYPNPFNPTTNIKFKIHRSALVNLSVYDITGKEVIILVNEDLSAGEYEYIFDGSHLTSGIYFYKLDAGGQKFTKKMMLIK